MKRNIINFLIDSLGLLCFTLLFITGIILFYILPQGIGHYHTLLELDRHEWGQIHFWIAVVMISTMCIHLFLHWRWILQTIKSDSTNKYVSRLGIGIILLCSLIIFIVTPLLGVVDSVENNYSQIMETPVSANHQVNNLIESNIKREDKNISNVYGGKNKIEASVHQNYLLYNINGSYTLQEVEDLTGVSCQILLKNLSLPFNIPDGTKLGYLKRKYGFKMSDIRRIIQNVKSTKF